MSAQDPHRPGGQKDDYFDKGFAMAQKKFAPGTKVDRAKSEKITDGIRKIFEKLTGKKVPSSISN
ncbi:MAG: hypothetical protein M1815_002430 [Lichina confinis]|nr:MAG: hypothetical protein M1815_002430 [Lichina confinis]